jgi:hypothetical protein
MTMRKGRKEAGPGQGVLFLKKKNQKDFYPKTSVSGR